MGLGCWGSLGARLTRGPDGFWDAGGPERVVESREALVADLGGVFSREDGEGGGGCKLLCGGGDDMKAVNGCTGGSWLSCLS